MGNDLHLREFLESDLDAIHAINQAEVPAVSDVTAAALGHIAEQAIIALVAERDTTVGGFCLVLAPGADYTSENYGWFSERYDDFIYLDRIALAPAFQRQGVGHAMYAEVERLAAERAPGADAFTLEVNLEPRNDPSLAFHDRLGFTEVGVRAPSPDYRVSMMARALRPDK